LIGRFVWGNTVSVLATTWSSKTLILTWKDGFSGVESVSGFTNFIKAMMTVLFTITLGGSLQSLSENTENLLQRILPKK